MTRVLLVEDDKAHARLLHGWLSDSGYDVTVAHKLETAVAQLHTRWDIIVTDAHLDDGTGVDLAVKAKAKGPDVPVVLVTAEASVEVAISALRSGIDDILLKRAPLRPAQLCDKVAELLAGRQKRLARRGERQVVLAIGAHPDDVEIGCGGALARHHAQGDITAILCVTSGGRGGAAPQRMAEAAHAAEILGARLIAGAQTDGSVSEGADTIAIIERAIAAVKPSIIYVHGEIDTHQDHRAVHRAAMVAARRIPNVYCYQSPSSTVDFRPTVFVDIAPYLDVKLRAIAAHDSQASRHAYLDPALLSSTARYWGRFAGLAAVEPFAVVRASVVAGAAPAVAATEVAHD